MLSLRLPHTTSQRLQQVARARGVTIAQAARQAIFAGLRPLACVPWSYGVAGHESSVPLSVSVEGVLGPEARTIALEG